MNDDEQRAFAAGYRYAIEESILAHDDVLRVATAAPVFERCCGLLEQAHDDHERIVRAMERVAHLRFDGHEQAFALWHREVALWGSE